MNSAQFRTIKAIIAGVLAVVIAASILRDNFIIPIIAVTLALAVLFYARSRVKEVIADERDIEVSGKAAGIAIQIFSFATILPMFAFFAMRNTNPTFEPIATTLGYSACFLMLTYSIIYKYYDRVDILTRKAPYAILIGLIIGLMVIFGMRFISGEDDWICANGSWVKHGVPSAPMPTIPCRQ
jgi:uncharacterized membrane protein